MSYNKIILLGRLVRDIELRYTSSGGAIASVSIATNHNYTSNGEKKEEVCYTDLTFFGRSGEIANQYLRKGSQILVEGRLKFDQWVDQNGQKRSKHSVVVETMKMMDTKSDNQGQSQQQQDSSHPQYQNPVAQEQQQYQQQHKAEQQMLKSDDIPVIDIDEDEIPF